MHFLKLITYENMVVTANIRKFDNVFILKARKVHKITFISIS